MHGWMDGEVCLKDCLQQSKLFFLLRNHFIEHCENAKNPAIWIWFLKSIKLNFYNLSHEKYIIGHFLFFFLEKIIVHFLNFDKIWDFYRSALRAISKIEHICGKVLWRGLGQSAKTRAPKWLFTLGPILVKCVFWIFLLLKLTLYNCHALLNITLL